MSAKGPQTRVTLLLAPLPLLSPNPNIVWNVKKHDLPFSMGPQSEQAPGFIYCPLFLLRLKMDCLDLFHSGFRLGNGAEMAFVTLVHAMF